MWRLGFFFHEIAFGLLSIFIPLYVVSPRIGGSLFDLGVMTATALLLAIPASFFWGYLCDKTRHYKRYILLSFISLAILLYVLSFAADVRTFIILYVVMTVLHVAHEAPKNVLIAEHYPRDDWGKSYALYEGFTEIGWIIGLITGLFTATLTLSPTSILMLCSGLNVAAFLLALLFIADPIIIFERRLVSIEKKIDYTYNGVRVFSRLEDGFSLHEKFRSENFMLFGAGLVLFSLASSIFFTPLPIFFSNALALPANMVFLIYILNSSGTMLGYFFAVRNSASPKAKLYVRRLALLRGMLVLILALIVNFAFSPTLLASVILIFMGFAYASYHILTLSLSMELIPAGKAGLFDVLVGLGSSSGSFIGPFIAENFGFLPQFLIASTTFFMAYVFFKFFA
ncbi:MAG: MFS transporter [Candidatus Bathyarchaeota archaeon]|nr:MFS transporter [Candidatus Bathyarchaeota archaeon]